MSYKLNLKMGLEEKLLDNLISPLNELSIGTISFAVDSKCLFIDAFDKNKNIKRIPLYAHGLTQQDGTLLDTSRFMLNNDPKGTGSFSLNRKEDSSVGENSFTEGTNNIASGSNSHAGGINTIIAGANSFGFGEGIKLSGANTYAFGSYNEYSPLTVFAIGNGTDDSHRQNILELKLSNGNGVLSVNQLLATDIKSSTISAAGAIHANGDIRSDNGDIIAATGSIILGEGNITVEGGNISTSQLYASNINVTNNLTVKNLPVATENFVTNYTSNFVTESEVNNIIETNTTITDNIQSQIDAYVPFVESTTEPSDKKKIWIDTSTTIPTMKYYSTSKSAWTKLGAYWG